VLVTRGQVIEEIPDDELPVEAMVRKVGLSRGDSSASPCEGLDERGP
jgi:hypothetical protein